MGHGGGEGIIRCKAKNAWNIIQPAQHLVIRAKLRVT
jgi:hypothetical protein